MLITPVLRNVYDIQKYLNKTTDLISTVYELFATYIKTENIYGSKNFFLNNNGLAIQVILINL